MNLQQLLDSAHRNNADAQYQLFHYFKLLGSVHHSESWLKKAAANGHRIAQNNLMQRVCEQDKSMSKSRMLRDFAVDFLELFSSERASEKQIEQLQKLLQRFLKKADCSHAI